MTTHDALSYAVATHAVREMRIPGSRWSTVFSPSVHITSSRVWPMPDFVVRDPTNRISLAAEFKPPAQTKREYLTGLGQAVAYTRDFDYAALILPTYADDGYAIGGHVASILEQPIYATAPISLWTYDPARLSPSSGTFDVARELSLRHDPLMNPVSVADSFYAKWREASPDELARFLDYLYDEGRVTSPRPIRDRAFERLWMDIAAGRTVHWGNQQRSITNTPTNETAWGKNYRNFVSHVGWTMSHGALTESGLNALHAARLYGAQSSIFIDRIAHAVLLDGKHLILINAICHFQDTQRGIDDEPAWLAALEAHLDAEGLLKRNPARRDAATRDSARGFLKAEKQLWRNLELIVPRGARVFHPGRGFIFNWARITSLVSS